VSGQGGHHLLRRICEGITGAKSPADPQLYDLWFQYSLGDNPTLNALIDMELTREDLQKEVSCDVLALKAVESTVTALSLAGPEAKPAEPSADPSTSQMRHSLTKLASATHSLVEENRDLKEKVRSQLAELELMRDWLETIRIDARTDALTKLSNRKHFNAVMQVAIDNAEESKTPLALILLDVDHFKRFNDEHGHLTGDKVLQLIAEMIRSILPPLATGARFGGEEFAIVLPGTTYQDALSIAESLRILIMSREISIHDSTEKLPGQTISLGMCEYETGDSMESLLHRTDLCLLQAKRSGRNRTIGGKDYQSTSAAA
jgi:diguanylate cyclase